jgi:hypothetical protein
MPRAQEREHERTRQLSVSEIAWLALLPCALATLAAIVVLGPLLGRLLFEPTGVPVYPGVPVRPEPTEHGRYAMALLGAALLAGAIAVGSRRRIALPPALVRPAVVAIQAATLLFLLMCTLTPYDTVANLLGIEVWPIKFFRPATLLTGVLFALLLTAALRSTAVVERVRGWAREDRRKLIGCGAVATLYTADWLLRAINFDSTIGNAFNLNLLEWELTEPFAILNGRTTLVDFHAVYSQLWSYAGAATLWAFGATLGTWTIAMALASGLVMLAVFAILRRVTDSAVLALALYLPTLAVAYWVLGTPSQGTSIVQVFSIWPIRYGGPFLLAWLTARHLAGDAPRRPWPLFLVAGLVLINNLEFGLGALLATCVACASVAPPRAWPRLASRAALGLLGAAAAVSALTLVRAGSLPHFGLIAEFPRLFGIEGWGALPMPALGMHLMFYGTYVGAVGLATVRAVRAERDALLTGMLMWAGTFGLIGAGYYVGRSEGGTFLCLFPAWIFALVLLLVAIARGLLDAGRLPELPELAVMFGFGLAIAALPNTPLPWRQVDRLQTPAPTQVFKQPAATRFVAARTERGEHVAILALLGHRLAHDLGLVNVSPYSTVEAVRTPEQLAVVLHTLDRERIDQVFVRTPESSIGEDVGNLEAVYQGLAGAGFKVASQEPELIEFARGS